ncbi:MAG: CHASE2 domain-containing protein [Prosthecobacter sp.]|nr:CHASE2 domain-containing protein [Prosthecobacter sp.]
MLLRTTVLLICLAATGWYVNEQQRAGDFQHVDDLFLDFLVANARDRFSLPDTKAEERVVFVQMREEDSAEYAAWPPPPLDWQTVLKSLQAYEPGVVVIATPLTWGRPSPDFAAAVTEALLPFPSVVLGIETELAGPERQAPAFMGDLSDALPRFQRVDGDLHAVPRLASLISAPDPAFRNQAELGLLSARLVKEMWMLPYVIREGDTLVPSILAQALSRHSRSPYMSQRLRLGPGAGAYLREGLFVPLEVSGEMAVDFRTSVPTVNALHLMTGTLADGTGMEDKTALGKGKIVVLGFDRESSGSGPRLARLYAQALKQVLALPRLRLLSQTEQWIAWSMAALGALWITLRVRRGRALIAGALFVFLALVSSFLVFQSSLIWFPPTMPAALLATGALVAFVIGRRSLDQETAPGNSAA